ncbi:fructosamine kinase [Xylariaceae sp. FL1272]|nr:fructosamine kinase [Xylariaceae sp. FL1272]
MLPLLAPIGRALPDSPDSWNARHHGHAGFSVPLMITAQYSDSTSRRFFCKSSGSEAMFSSEFYSMKVMSDAMPLICPTPIYIGPMDNQDQFFLLTDYLDMDSTNSSKGSGLSLATKLAILHNTAVTMPNNEKPMFGFPVRTLCGSTPQDNTFKSSWAEICEERHGADEELRMWIARTTEYTVSALLREGHLGGEYGIEPSMVHGDLWMGNRATGQIEGWLGPEDVCYDPSGVYAHNEYDFAIMRLFGGYMAGFWDQYHATKPKTEPIEEYEDRIRLYSVYHLMNHYAIHTGGWKEDAIEVMESLWEKYGAEVQQVQDKTEDMTLVA